MTGGAALSAKRCRNHGEREAAARCLSCARFYCRECVTEHEGRLLCAACIARSAAPVAGRVGRLRLIGRVAAALAGFLLVWALLVGLGALLLRIPPPYHSPGAGAPP